MRIEEDLKLDYNDVLLRPKRSTLGSRKEVDLKRSFYFKHSQKQWSGIPIIASNMDGVGVLRVFNELSKQNIITALTKQHSKEDLTIELIPEKNKDFIAISTGSSEASYENLKNILAKIKYINFICIDIANGYSDHFTKFVARVRKDFNDKTIIAGNVVTADMTQELILSGADIVKVGIGPGSVCTTRLQTGVGYPQLSAVIECADAAHGLGAHIIADGGCTSPGDVAKAFGGGADFVMLGGMLAGHDEGEGTIVQKEGRKFIEFYGSSSETALEKHYGGLMDYRSSEGRIVSVPYRGAISNTISNILGGLRSACSYVGASSLKQISKCTTFIRVNRQLNNPYEAKK